MKLVDLTGVPVADLPVNAFRDHLRLGTGFADDTLQEPVLESVLGAALAAIEARTGKVLFRRPFRWTLPAWRNPERQPLPVAPVTEVTSVSVLARNGDVVGGGLGDVVLLEDTQRPVLVAAVSSLPPIPVNGVVEIGFDAGFSPDWSGMPPDLAQAVLMLAAYFYEVRHEEPVNDGNMPFAVANLIAPYRTVRVLGGAPA
jgi:uncharacterized phiE125 gp8 family phage protein